MFPDLIFPTRRADAYPATKRFTRPAQSPCVQLVGTFLDALILSCLGPPDHPSLETPIKYVRPRMPEHFPVVRTGCAKSTGPTGPIIVVADSSDDDADDADEPTDAATSSVPINKGGSQDQSMQGITATPSQEQPQTPQSTIPKSVLELLKDTAYDQRKFPDIFLSHPVLTVSIHFQNSV